MIHRRIGVKRYQIKQCQKGKRCKGINRFEDLAHKHLVTKFYYHEKCFNVNNLFNETFSGLCKLTAL